VDIARPPVTLAAAVRHAAAVRPDHPALIAGDEILSWADLDAAVDRCAAGLLALTGAPGDRVAIALPDSLDFAVAILGAFRAGLTAVPVNPGYTRPELAHVLGDSGARVLVATDDVHSRVDDGPVRVPPKVPDPGGPPVALPAEPAADAVGLLLYTSGTEGRPKGAMLTHAALMANHDQLAALDPAPVGPGDTVLLGLPLFHAYGLNTGLGAVARHGACGVLTLTADPLTLIARHRVSVVVGVPSMYAAWAARPEVRDAFAGVRVAVCGAAPLDPADAARFTAATGRDVHIGYGLTETAPVLTTTWPAPNPKPGSIGRPLPGVELRLRTAEQEPDEVEFDLTSPTDPGEIVVRGANLFAGYWPDGRGGPVDGWWGTGDVAYADADGDLFLVDRIGELILVNGFNVYPREVEQAIEDHPAVLEAAAVGVPHPGTGQTVRAYVVTRADVTVEELAAHCAGRLARFKRPTAIEIVAELPHSAIGKVRKTVLRGDA
jgi:long-chain acyl-CoA synthetase